LNDGGAERRPAHSEPTVLGSAGEPALLGPAEIRALAERLGVRPTKQLGQNFVIDPNTIRRIVPPRRCGPTMWWSRSVPASAR